MTTFCAKGKADFSVGGQFGSEAKGAAVAWLAIQAHRESWSGYDIVTTNSGSQAGHTVVHDGKTWVTRHLPTAPLIRPGSIVYLNAGAIIDPAVLQAELEDHDYLNKCTSFFIHPNAAVITPDCVRAEGAENSAQTAISSTRKGVGEALARKILRSGPIARDHKYLKQFICAMDLNRCLSDGASVLVEVPQGFSLGTNERFYPFCTSRNCTVGQGMLDAGIYPSFVGRSMLVLRTFPIRVGSLPNSSSGDCYPDQEEIDWQTIGVKPEITTVTGRTRRVFTWSQIQINEAVAANRPSLVYLSHCDYVKDVEPYVLSIKIAAMTAGMPSPVIALADGPSTNDVKKWEG